MSTDTERLMLAAIVGGRHENGDSLLSAFIVFLLRGFRE